MKEAIISDTSPLNYLVLIDAVELLPRLFSEVIIPPAVNSELSQPGTPSKVRAWFSQPSAWLERRTPKTLSLVQGLDAGETEAISLAEEQGISELLLDERKARNVATSRGLTPIGTLAILEIAGSRGWIDFAEFIRRLRGTAFRVHDKLIIEATTRVKARQLHHIPRSD